MVAIKHKLLSESLRANIGSIGCCVSDFLIEANNQPYSIKHIRNLHIRASGQLTFCPKHKETIVTSRGHWSRKHRQSGSYRRLVNRVLEQIDGSKRFTNSELESFVNELKSIYLGGEFRVIEGDKIPYWYNWKSYNNASPTGSPLSWGNGTLDKSCMRHKGCNHFFDLYINNPDKVKLLVFVNDSAKLLGRALLWYPNNETILMDRIYGNDVTIAKFKKYAKENRILHKLGQSKKCTSKWVDTGGMIINKYFEIEMDHKGMLHAPCMDTFKFSDGKRITNKKLKKRLKHIFNKDDGWIEEYGWDDINDHYTIKKYLKLVDSGSKKGLHTCSSETLEIRGKTYYRHDPLIFYDVEHKPFIHGDWVYIETPLGWAHKDNAFTCSHDGLNYPIESSGNVYQFFVNNISVYTGNYISYLLTNIAGKTSKPKIQLKLFDFD